MRLLATVLVTCVLTFACGCQNTSVRSFWDDVDISVTESNYQQLEDLFVRFSEEAVKAPEEDAAAAINTLFDRLKSDEVSYYVYSDWMKSSFYSILSPCRNGRLFKIAVDRIVEDGILDESTIERLSSLNNYISLNQKGQKCTLPEGAILPDGAKTLYLVVDISCPSCTAALRSLGSNNNCDKRIALCFGGHSALKADGWEFCFPTDMCDYFDLESTPVWFMVDTDGTVLTSYTLAD